MLLLPEDRRSGKKTDPQGPGWVKVFICDECIGICSEIMEEELKSL